jgi:putative thioredoxin
VACVGLARLLVERGELSEAREVLGKVPPGSDLQDKAEQVGALVTLEELAKDQPEVDPLRQQLEAGGSPELRCALGCALAKAADYEAALAELHAAGQQDRQLAKGKVRDAMLAVFTILGQGQPLVEDYRRKLASLLF